jgi:hypothetical protein
MRKRITTSMNLPTPESVRDLLESSLDIEESLKSRVLQIAQRLEELEEYHPEQALIVAADIVIHSQKTSAVSSAVSP